MARPTPLFLKENAWRFRISEYAERMSDSKWKPYPWLVFALWKTQAAIMRGGARVIVSAPPRHGKSEAFARWLPTWYLDTWPERRVILGSHGDEFAAEWGLKVRDELTKNPLAQSVVHPTNRKSDNWQTTMGGGMRSMGVGGSVVGRGGDLIVITDPHKSWMEVQSPTYRQRVIDWFNSDVYPRQEPGASIVVEHTRWHQGDLTGYLLREQGDRWEHVILPAIASEGDPLGRAPGEALCPERFDIDTLNDIKSKPAMSSSIFAALYQQQPTSAEGGMVKRDWFKRYDTLETFAGAGCFFQSWDLTFKSTGTSYVVGAVWAIKGPDIFLVDIIRSRLSFPETLKAMGELRRRWPQATDTLIEEAANGAAVIETLKEQVPGIMARRPHGSKEARLAAVSGFIESGNVWVPAASLAPWAEDFIDEVVTFPNGQNDDQVDVLSMALDRFAEKQSTITSFIIPDTGTRGNPWEFAYGTKH